MNTSQHATTDWPAQLRLPGQTAAPEGPVDMYMMYVMHHAFRRDLASSPRRPSARRRRTGSPGGCSSSAGRSSPRRCTGTTAARTPASGRCSSSAAPPTTWRRWRRWRPSTRSSTRCSRPASDGFARLAEHADDDARAALAVRLAATRECLARHLEHEETGAIPIIQRAAHPGGLGAPRRGALQGGPVPGQDRADRAVGGVRRAARGARPRLREDRARLQGRLAG